MKDYSELVRSLKHCPADYILVSEAATAIERLQKERDAALVDVCRSCRNCKYSVKPTGSNRCRKCAAYDAWEWKGVYFD